MPVRHRFFYYRFRERPVACQVKCAFFLEGTYIFWVQSPSRQDPPTIACVGCHFLFLCLSLVFTLFWVVSAASRVPYRTELCLLAVNRYGVSIFKSLQSAGEVPGII